MGQTQSRSNWIKIINTNNTKKIQQFLLRKDVRFENYFPYKWAIFNGKYDSLKCLIQRDLASNSGYCSFLMENVKNGHLDIVKIFVENGAIQRNAELDNYFAEAIKFNQLEVVKYLLDKGANIHLSNDWPLLKAMENKNFELVDFLLSKCEVPFRGDTEFLMFFAEQSEEPGLVQLLSNYGIYSKLSNNIISKRLTKHDCLITYDKIHVGAIYYLCPGKSDHVYLKSAFDSWNQLNSLNGNNPLICCLCKKTLKVYVNCA